MKTFEPIRRARVFETVAQSLRESIYSGEFRPGDKLPTEQELAQMFGVSTAAVRSALLNLEQSGLIRIRQGAGGGFFVKELDFKPVRDSFNHLLRMGTASIAHLAEIRKILEPETTSLAAQRASVDDIAKIGESIDQLENNMKLGLPRKPSDFDFHVCVAEGAKNPVAMLVMGAVRDVLYESVGSYDVGSEKDELIIRQHREIFEAIRTRDSVTARERAQVHVETMEALFREHETRAAKG